MKHSEILQLAFWEFQSLLSLLLLDFLCFLSLVQFGGLSQERSLGRVEFREFLGPTNGLHPLDLAGTQPTVPLYGSMHLT